MKELRALGVHFIAKDFTSMLAAGRRMGWSEAMLRANEELAARGKCFDFSQGAPPGLKGSLFEDNIFFSFVSAQHLEASLPVIQRLADALNARVHGGG